eukprot:scaffold11778_cov64-Skeletonema_dohrnii-CCMP3373.AAC.2
MAATTGRWGLFIFGVGLSAPSLLAAEYQTSDVSVTHSSSIWQNSLPSVAITIHDVCCVIAQQTTAAMKNTNAFTWETYDVPEAASSDGAETETFEIRTMIAGRTGARKTWAAAP